jgi:LuxR family maltose regulon positive regulatory protein
MTGGGSSAAPSFALEESKLRPASPRTGIVPRSAIVERLTSAPVSPVVTVIAPAGYGKTTVLAQWALVEPRVAWVTLDHRDNDPAVLLAYLAAALDRVERTALSLRRSAVSSGLALSDVGRIVSAVSSLRAPVIVMLDQAEALTNRQCRDIVSELALRLPAGSRVAVGSRDAACLPVPRLRARGDLLEIGVESLAMDASEARSVLEGAGVDLSEPDRNELLARTEGWPAGLYLAALAIKAGGPHAGPGVAFSGDDRFVGDYLRMEFLDRVSRADVSFLTRTSILDRLSGPLCDAVMDRRGSIRVLDRLERSNLMVVSQDRRGEWYRYHHLFQDLLRSELERREPEMMPELHRRAASWLEASDLPEAAIGHAQQAGDADRVARLVLMVANPAWRSGRLDTVLRWMEWFAKHDVVQDHPAIAVHGALIYALIGRAGDAERWATAAERTTFTGLLPDGNTMDGTLAYLRALLCRDGLDGMRRHAHQALDGLSATSPYRLAMLHALDAADLLQGRPQEAEVYFNRAVDEATSGGQTPFLPVLMVERGIVAIELGDRDGAEALATQALAMVRDGQFDDYWTSALVLAWGAGLAARRGDLGQARDCAARASRLRPLLTYALPVVSAQALLELARASVSLGDVGGARAALRQIQDIHHHRRDLGSLPGQADQLRSQIQAAKAEMVGVASLTSAELRLLPFLATHLSLAEIGERLLISRNTVKTQAISIYRKLGASSRSETIVRMQEFGLATHVVGS